MIIGYVLGIILIPRFISQVKVFQICAVLGGILTLFILYANVQVNFLSHVSDVSIWFVVLLGLPNSLVWAGIWPLALDGLGRFTKLGSSILIMGLSGNAIMPLVYGHYADISGLRNAYWVLFPCYLFLVYYSFYGYAIRSWTFTKSKKKLVSR